MSTSREGCVVILPPTDAFLRLVEKAASDHQQELKSAQEKPVTKLKRTLSCDEVWKEYKSLYQDKIQPGSSIATILNPEQVTSWWIPETFVLMGGSFRIPPKTSAVAIPLLEEDSPKIEYNDPQGETLLIEWKIGSVIYLAGNSSLKSDGRGKVAFVFGLFSIA